MPKKRTFTLEEAQRTLPLVRRVVEDIMSTWVEMSELDRRQAALQAEGAREDAELTKIEMEAAAQRIDRLARELEPIGCALKDPRVGLIDFPAKHDGRDVLLCWKHGEPTIAFWHEIDAGFDGRQPVATLQPTPKP